MTPIAPTTAPRRRGLKVALILSLMINLLLVGLLAGGAWRVARLQSAMGGMPDMRALWRALPDELRDDLREGPHVQGLHHDRSGRAARVAAMNLALAEALRAEVFDPAGFAALLAGDRDETGRRLDAANAALAQGIAALAPDARRALADRFEGALHRRRGD